MALFPSALIACIAEARKPSDGEVSTVAEHIWNDAFRPLTGLRWESLGDREDRRLTMLSVAQVAMRGTALPPVPGTEVSPPVSQQLRSSVHAVGAIGAAGH